MALLIIRVSHKKLMQIRAQLYFNVASAVEYLYVAQMKDGFTTRVTYIRDDQYSAQ